MTHPIQIINQKAFNSDKNVQDEIKNLIDKFNIKYIVETGTYQAFTTRFLANIDKEINVYSIECWDVPYKESLSYTKNYNNIKLYNNKSEIELKNLLPNLKDKCDKILFYLDAHWHNTWPILEELKIISDNFYDRAIIVIDDFYVPNKKFTYDIYKSNISLNYNYIQKHLNSCYSNYIYYYNKNPNMIIDKKGNLKEPSGKIYIIPNKLLEQYNLNGDYFYHTESNTNYSNFL